MSETLARLDEQRRADPATFHAGRQIESGCLLWHFHNPKHVLVTTLDGKWLAECIRVGDAWDVIVRFTQPHPSARRFELQGDVREVAMMGMAWSDYEGSP